MRKSDQEKAEIQREVEARRRPDKERTDHEGARGVRRSAKKSLSHLSRAEIERDEFVAAVEELAKSTDRSAAIVGGAFVEDGLREVLSSLLKRKFDSKAVFEDQGAPFGTFKQKIVAVQAFGYCTKELAEDANAIRDIRNQFSHALRPLTFDNPDIAATCFALRNHHPDFDPKNWSTWSPRARFVTACQQISLKLMRQSRDLMEQHMETLRANTEELHAQLSKLSETG